MVDATGGAGARAVVQGAILAGWRRCIGIYRTWWRFVSRRKYRPLQQCLSPLFQQPVMKFLEQVTHRSSVKRYTVISAYRPKLSEYTHPAKFQGLEDSAGSHAHRCKLFHRVESFRLRFRWLAGEFVPLLELYKELAW
ncbi:hypothetical protein CBM2615_B60084 [Cupriavidus taiwanensis]|uniref:Uncharacterized protein n=1 Tax=Cupriavidus taiwanensis TaxID=164546 RepID=A0A976B2V1_9BURK|nr:hypothetical protein CBM2614_B50079 [Cupriavidus taiwanensis]SOZ69738.1 hypothetical protein CBM2615_B60084 [Cupriavidus taiwanensis]SOZ72934.1 hypothetical protein CBM2613_B50082 [Cupriavidus taiwanensis]SPA09791.1 hypothetical protein CBM2625_B50080 [Cupriavidus taiwanensis]